jgi:GAF domain
MPFRSSTRAREERAPVLAEELRDSRRPPSVASVHRPGPMPHQVLLFGAGPLMGVGLESHDDGMPGHLADSLSAVTRRGVDIDVAVDRDPTGVRACAGLRGLRLRRFDAVIVVIAAPSTVPSSAAGWPVDIARLLQTLQAEVAQGAPVVLCDASLAVLQLETSGRLDKKTATATKQRAAITERACADSARVRYTRFDLASGSAPAEGRFSERTYREWAETTGKRLRAKLVALDRRAGAATPHAFREQAEDERLRQRSLDTMGLQRGVPDARLDLLVRRARLLFDAGEAAINIIDGDEQWQLATTAPHPTTVPRAVALCTLCIKNDDLLLINDTRLDPRVQGTAVAESGIRFYAAYPIHTWDGYRIGAVTISDTAPRAMVESELRDLRDVADRVEQHIWLEALER